MPSRKKKSTKAERPKSSLAKAWQWLVAPAAPAKSRRKTALAYHEHGAHCQHSESYRRAKPRSSRQPKAGLGAVCVCAPVCRKKHAKHTESCGGIMCVCAHPVKRGSRNTAEAARWGRSGSSRRRTALAYHQPSVSSEANAVMEIKPDTLSRKIPKLREGTLRRHGYSSKASKEERHAALRKAALAEGPTVVIRKLNVVATLNKNKRPQLCSQLKTDSAWVKSTFGTTAHPK